jgi:hypothetical protein
MGIKKLTCKEVLERVQGRLPYVIGMEESSYVDVKTTAVFIDEAFGNFTAIPAALYRDGKGHPKRKRYAFSGKRLSVDDIEKRIQGVHGDTVRIVRTSYVNVNKKAIFVDSDYGEWPATVIGVLRGRGHPQRGYDRTKTPLRNIKKIIFEKHGNTVSIIDSTHTKVRSECSFMDVDYGEWISTPARVMDGHGHPDRANEGKKLNIEEVRLKLKKFGDEFILDETTYTGLNETARFVDKDHGEFWSLPRAEFIGHPKRKLDKIRKTNLERYGVEHLSQDPSYALTHAKKLQNTTLKIHWKTGEELICQAGYEPKVVDYLNSKKIDFLWQPQTFTTPLFTKSGTAKTYRPDLFLIEPNTWVEIKGYMRPHSQIKWDWFLTQFPNAELWNEPKLKMMGIL